MQDAEDIVQETLLAAWRGLSGFEERASLRTWLYRIATNRCLNALRARPRRRARLPDGRRRPSPPPVPSRSGSSPTPTRCSKDIAETLPGPEARYETREALGLAFMAGLQHLPPRQRAALVLREVLGFRTAEVAEMLETSEASVKGCLQRARATLDARLRPAIASASRCPDSAPERELVGRFAAAVESGRREG